MGRVFKMALRGWSAGTCTGAKPLNHNCADFLYIVEAPVVRLISLQFIRFLFLAFSRKTNHKVIVQNIRALRRFQRESSGELVDLAPLTSSVLRL